LASYEAYCPEQGVHEELAMGSHWKFLRTGSKVTVNGQSQKIDLSDLCGGKKVEG